MTRQPEVQAGLDRPATGTLSILEEKHPRVPVQALRSISETVIEADQSVHL
jgi:hypothetical protein